MEEEKVVAWVCFDGEVTESESISNNWKFFGHEVIDLTESQYNEIKRRAVIFASSLAS